MNANEGGGASRDEIFRQRAERLARLTSDAAPRRIAARIALVGAGKQQLGLPVESLRELVEVPEITPLPGLPRWLLGIAQVRGEIVSVVDLGAILGASVERASAIALVEGAGGPVALLVESVLGFREVYEDELSETNEADTRRPVRAMTRDLIAILDVKRLPIAHGEGTSVPATNQPPIEGGAA